MLLNEEVLIFFLVVTISSTLKNNKRNSTADFYIDSNDKKPECKAVSKNNQFFELLKTKNDQILSKFESVNFQQQQFNKELSTKFERLDRSSQEIFIVIHSLMQNIKKVCHENYLKELQIQDETVKIINDLFQKIEQHEEKFEIARTELKLEVQTFENRFREISFNLASFNGKFEEFKNSQNNQNFSILNEKLDRVLKQQEVLLNSSKKLNEERNLPKDCEEVRQRGTNASGIYFIKPGLAHDGFWVFCDMKTSGGSWIYLMNRYNGSENFNKSWSDYKLGFGKLDGEFWLGLEQIHILTVSKINELLVELVDWDNKTVRAFYTNFAIGNEEDDYLLKILEGFHGDVKDSLSYHLNKKFSTFDHKKGACPDHYSGGWWFSHCYTSHLTGHYLTPNASKTEILKGIHWNGFHYNNYSYSLKQVRMMIRPQQENSILLPHEKN